MGLSQWPEKFRDKSPRGKMVTVTFDEPLLCLKTTAKAVLLGEPEDDDPLILPISQIESNIPDMGDWVEWVTIPKWLADEKGLEYDE